MLPAIISIIVILLSFEKLLSKYSPISPIIPSIIPDIPICLPITISIKNNKFKIEYNYNKITGGGESYYNHHIYWRYKYLHIEPHSKKEKRAIIDYENDISKDNTKTEEYISGIYLKRKINVVAYDTVDFKNTQRVEYLANKQETQRIRNQILSDKFTKI